MATDPRGQSLHLLLGYHCPSNLLPEGYEESFDKSWYQDHVQYRESVKPKLGTDGPSYDWASDTYTAGRRSSLILDDIAHGTPANITKCDGSLEDTAGALIIASASVKSQDLVIDGFSSHDPGVEQARLTPALEEPDLIIEQDTARTHQQVLDQQVLDRQILYQRMRDQKRVLEERLRGFEARMQAIAAEERAGVATKGNHVKGRRRGLPLLLEAHGGQQEIMTCYDTGTHDNHISRAKAIELGYTIEPSPDTKAGFQLPNGKVIKAVGQIFVAVQFAKRVGPEAASMVCRFNVFEKLASPILIGMTFLKATQTITKYTSRMVNLPPTWKHSLRLCAVGSATNQVACIIDGRKVTAYADTGSEIALISGPYARERGFSISQGCEELELADGSLEYTSGFADLDIRVLNPDDWDKGPRSKSKWKLNPVSEIESTVIRFHVLEGLQFDVILDEEATDILNIFQGGFATILSAAFSFISGICPIIHLRSVEASFVKMKERVGERTKDLYTSIRSKYTSIVSKTTLSAGSANAATPVDISNIASQARADEMRTLISELGQAENRRLDQIERRGISAADDVQKQRYELERTKLLEELRGLRIAQGP